MIDYRDKNGVSLSDGDTIRRIDISPEINWSMEGNRRIGTTCKWVVERFNIRVGTFSGGSIIHLPLSESKYWYEQLCILYGIADDTVEPGFIDPGESKFKECVLDHIIDSLGLDKTLSLDEVLKVINGFEIIKEVKPSTKKDELPVGKNRIPWKWTSKQPTESGCYWSRHTDIHNNGIVVLVEQPGGINGFKSAHFLAFGGRDCEWLPVSGVSKYADWSDKPIGWAATGGAK
ncbi:MAG: hypothetical protein GY928_33650 [Colwellia sp.]|nr:hypothetical protein [Colwellia sp.]